MPMKTYDDTRITWSESENLLDEIGENIKDEDSQNSEDELNYQVALDALGFGKFHIWLLLVCGLANASDAVEILCVSLLLPAAECDLQLNSSEKGWLGAIIFIGMMIGSYLWGALGDIYGRRNILSIALLINGIFGGFSGFAQNFWFFLLMRFISGLGVGGSIPLVWSYFAEFQPSKHRASQMCLLAGFWMVGNVITSGLGWLIIPQYEWGYFSESFTFNSWRIFILICSAFSISSGLLLFCFPKSPIFLLKQCQFEQAYQVLYKVHRMNHNSSTKYEYRIVENIKRNSEELKKLRQSTKGILNMLLGNIKSLFSTSLRRNAIILIVVNFSLALGYYGLWLWFPELFNRLASYTEFNNGISVSVCDIPHEFIKNMSRLNNTLNCQQPVLPSVFFDSFILALSNLPGVILTVLFMDKFGRKYFLAGGLITSSVSIFFIWLVKSRIHNLVLSCCFGGFSVVSFNALNVVSAELFPTEIRSTAMGIFLFIARIGAILGNVLFGYLVDLACEVPILLIASLMGGSGLLSLLLPDTTRIRLN